jgi:Family of unknown function (DUF6159)
MFGQSWEMLRQSYAVLQRQKTLVVLPVLSSLLCLLVAASFVAPLFLFPDLTQRLLNAADRAGQQDQWQVKAVWLAVLFVYYFVNYLVIAYFNTALASCAIVHFKGGEPTLGDGLAAAGRRLPQLAAWALLAATVGMILRVIEDKSDKIGQFVVGLLGLAWTAATYLVVPVLAVEGVGPFTAVRRSVELLRHAWGEGLVGNFGLGLIGLLLMLPGIALCVLGVFLGMQTPALLVVCLALGIIYLVAVSIVLSTLKQIFIAGLYIYAAEGQVPGGFSPALVQDAFRRK